MNQNSLLLKLAFPTMAALAIQGCSVLNAANKLSNSIPSVPGVGGMPTQSYLEPGQPTELVRPEGKVLLASFVLDRAIYPDRGNEDEDRKEADEPGALNDTTEYWKPTRASIDTLWKLTDGLFAKLFPNVEWISAGVLAGNSTYEEKTAFKPIRILGQSTQLAEISPNGSGLRYLPPLVADGMNAVGTSVGADWILVAVTRAKVGNYTNNIVALNAPSPGLTARLNVETTLYWHKVGEKKIRQEVTFGALSQTSSTVIASGIDRNQYPVLFAEAYSSIRAQMEKKYTSQ